MRAKRVDENQKQVVSTLRKSLPGISVFITSSVGMGFPDLVIGYNGVNYLVELKDGSKSESKRKLTPAELEFKANWNGSYHVCNNADEILQIILFGL